MSSVRRGVSRALGVKSARPVAPLPYVSRTQIRAGHHTGVFPTKICAAVADRVVRVGRSPDFDCSRRRRIVPSVVAMGADCQCRGDGVRGRGLNFPGECWCRRWFGHVAPRRLDSVPVGLGREEMSCSVCSCRVLSVSIWKRHLLGPNTGRILGHHAQRGRHHKRRRQLVAANPASAQT